jgi:ketosteroid isomerase-like protein
MKSARLIFSVLILVAPIALLALQATPKPVSVEDEIKDFEQHANAAYEANDLAKYFSFYAADFSQLLPEGRTDLPQYQKDWTAYIGEGNRVQKVEISDMHVQVGPNKDTAVASYILHVRTKLKDGKVTDEDNQESDVIFKRNGEWKVVFLHYSSAAPKK